MKVDVYQDAGGRWRWRIKAKNGRIVADGSEGYRTRAGLRRALVAMADAAASGAMEREFAAAHDAFQPAPPKTKKAGR